MFLIWLLIKSVFILNTISEYEIVFKGHAHSDHFYADHLGNIYFIDKHKLIKILPRTGDEFEYGSITSGSITSADVSNPFQILLYYNDLNRLVFLDSKLALMRSEINLSELGYDNTLLACSSARGGFWVFCEREQRVVYFDQRLRDTHQSAIISSITRKESSPVHMTEHQNRLYINFPGNGILVFDQFASYIKTIYYYGPDRFQVAGGWIIFFLEGELIALDLENGSKSRINLPDDVKTDDATFLANSLYILSGNTFTKLIRKK